MYRRAGEWSSTASVVVEDRGSLDCGFGSMGTGVVRVLFKCEGWVGWEL